MGWKLVGSTDMVYSLFEIVYTEPMRPNEKLVATSMGSVVDFLIKQGTINHVDKITRETKGITCLTLVQPGEH